jgi:hypothetical protein
LCVESLVCTHNPRFRPDGAHNTKVPRNGNEFLGSLANPGGNSGERASRVLPTKPEELCSYDCPHVLSLAFSSMLVWFKLVQFRARFCVWSERCQTKHVAGMTTPVIGR